MLLNVTYVLSEEALSSFRHLKSRRLNVLVNPCLCACLDDFRARIADEILRTYGICCERFDDTAVDDWHHLVTKASRLFTSCYI